MTQSRRFSLGELRRAPGSRWQPGQSGNPKGRAVGSRSKLAENFLTDLYSAWQQFGSDAIARVVQRKPEIFLKIVAYVIPREFQVRSEGALSRLSDEQSNELISTINGQLAARAGSGSPAGEATAVGDKQLN
jgi:hypothetical protein